MSAAALGLSSGCDSSSEQAAVDAAVAHPDADGPDGLIDAAPPADASPPMPDASVDAAVPANQLPRPRFPASDTLEAPRDWQFARGLIHMHSIHSHDACDGDPKPDGVPDAVCLARLRAAICTNQFDYLLLTDHPGTFAEIPFEEAFLHFEGDTWINGDDGPIGNEVRCPDGHTVLLAVGSEGDLTPVMFQRKPDNALLRMATPEGVAGLRAAGALVFQVHTENHSADTLQPLGLDGIEIYNLHANLAPNGVLRQLAELLPDVVAMFQAGDAGPHPDLSFLAVFRANHLALATWDTLSGRGERVLGFAGSDIHENLPLPLRPADGDRMDSYRRLSTWFSNYVLVHDRSWHGLRAGLEAQRVVVGFDLLGPPNGFDFYAESPNGAIVEMGSEGSFGLGWQLVARMPSAPEEAPTEMVLYRIDAQGTHEVLRTTEDINLPLEQAGSYRVEVMQTPTHLAPEMGAFEHFIRPTVWLYSNPVHLR
jgi:hypothetical protein